MWFYPTLLTGRRTIPVHRRHGWARPPHVFLLALAALALLAFGTTRAQPGFQAPLSFDVGASPVAVAVADLNHDGKADLAVANNGSDTVSVLLGNGDGTFQAAVDYPTGTTPNGVAVADLNGDGIPDLAVANIGSQSVSVLLGNGDGTYKAAVDYPASGPLYAVAVGDFNSDGIPDLAVANAGTGYVLSGSVSILLGNGDGTWQARTDIAVAGKPGDRRLRMGVEDGIHDELAGDAGPGRLPGLERRLRHIAQRPGVWFAPRDEIARFWMREFAPSDAWNLDRVE